MPDLRVLYVIDSLAPGGAETSLVEMATGLVRSGIELHVLPLGESLELAPALQDTGAVLHPRPTRRGRPGNIRAVLEVARRTSPGLIHTTLYESDIAGRSAARLLRVPCSTSIVGDSYGPSRRAEVDPFRLRMALALDQLSARHASFHAVSQSLAARTSQFLRVPGNRIEVIPRGRDPRKYLFRSAGLRESTRSELGIPLDAPTILAVGRMEPAKGQLHLMRGLPVVAAAHPGLVVLVAGKEGASGDDLRSAARGLPADIRFLGHRNDVPALLAAADVLCFPSLREGSPGTLIEAMAVGCPVVASDIPPNYEVLGSGARSAGQLINTQDPQALGDAVNRALANPDFTTHRAQVGRARFEERFTIDAVVTRMADFYLSAAASFSRQPTKP